MMIAIGQKYRPAIIVADGSYQADHIIISFETLYPALSQGGIYIVEDLGLHTGPDAGAKRVSYDRAANRAQHRTGSGLTRADG